MCWGRGLAGVPDTHLLPGLCLPRGLWGQRGFSGSGPMRIGRGPCCEKTLVSPGCRVLSLIFLSLRLLTQVCPTLRPCGLQHACLPHLSLSPKVVMLSSHLILCRLLLLPSIFPSVRIFSYESALRIRWAKDWRFSFSISLSSEYWKVKSLTFLVCRQRSHH